MVIVLNDDCTIDLKLLNKISKINFKKKQSLFNAE